MSTKMSRKTKMKKIRFCEPYIQANSRKLGVDFEVNESFYHVLRNPPTPSKLCLSIYGNGYLFGPKFNMSEYVLLGSHENDGEQTGLVDITNATKKELRKIVKSYDEWEDAYDGYSESWDWRPGLIQVRQTISPRILFVGGTEGGDVGANLWVHYDKYHMIDSLCIDNSCRF